MSHLKRLIQRISRSSLGEINAEKDKLTNTNKQQSITEFL